MRVFTRTNMIKHFCHSSLTALKIGDGLKVSQLKVSFTLGAVTVAEGYVGLHIIGKFSNYFQCNSCCRSQQICSIGSVNQPLAMKNIQQVNTKSAWVAALALWFCLCLPSCGPRFESQAHHLRFFQFVLLKLY